jgi:uncharacterized membrane protein
MNCGASLEGAPLPARLTPTATAIAIRGTRTFRVSRTVTTWFHHPKRMTRTLVPRLSDGFRPSQLNERKTSMATLTIWRFGSTRGADRATEMLTRLAKEQLITLHDAATVSWERGSKKPMTRQLHQVTGSGALSGAFWGMLFGLIFFVPLLGAAVGASLGALTGSLTDVGITDDLIKRVRAEIVPGTSALFILSSDAVIDRIRDAFEANDKPTLTFTNLSTEEENKLREVFAVH